ncbi:hypothetical protein MY1884_009202 [Beauveria asiatica]
MAFRHATVVEVGSAAAASDKTCANTLRSWPVARLADTQKAHDMHPSSPPRKETLSHSGADFSSASRISGTPGRHPDVIVWV